MLLILFVFLEMRDMFHIVYIVYGFHNKQAALLNRARQ